MNPLIFRNHSDGKKYKVFCAECAEKHDKLWRHAFDTEWDLVCKKCKKKLLKSEGLEHEIKKMRCK